MGNKSIYILSALIFMALISSSALANQTTHKKIIFTTQLDGQTINTPINFNVIALVQNGEYKFNENIYEPTGSGSLIIPNINTDAIVSCSDYTGLIGTTQVLNFENINTVTYICKLTSLS